MPLLFRQKVVLFKPEGIYGIDANPTGAADAVLARDIQIRPMEGADIDRGHETPFLSANATIPHDLHMVISLKVELAGSGTAGTPPAWGPLIRACGIAETITPGSAVTYNPISDGFESGTLYLNIAGTLYAMRGARGNADIVIGASGIPQLELTLTGLWNKPADAALPVPDFSAWQQPLVASDTNTPTFTIGGADQVLRSFKLGFGNDVQGRFLINREEIVIADRSDMIEAQIEATALTTFDPFGLARDQSTVALQLAHGTQPGGIATIDVPAAQVQRPGAPTEAQGIKEWPLNLTPLPVSGNDQWTLTLT